MKTMKMLAILTLALLTTGVYGWSYNLESFTITTNDVDSTSLSIGGNVVVWEDMTTMAACGYDLAMREMFTIPSNDVTWMGVSNNGKFVIWQDMMSMDLYGHDLTTKETFIISTGDVDSMGISVGGNLVAWKDTMSGKLYGYDLATKKTFIVSTGNVDWMSVSNNDKFVLWQTMAGMNLYGYNVSTKETFIISTGGVDSMSISVGGNFVVWKDTIGVGLYGYDLVSRETFIISPKDISWMGISNNDKFVVWQDMMSIDLYGYDLTTKETFIVSTDDVDTMSICISGNFIVWRGMTEPNDGLYGVLVYRIANDSCSDAIQVVDDAPYNGDTTGAAGTDLSSCAYNDTNDVWHFYVPNAGGQVTIHTDGSAFDTTLAVFNACDGNELACNDDYCLDNTQSKVAISVVKGKTYFIRVAGFNGQMGTYQLLVTRGVCVEPIKSDLNGDCKVDMFDFAVMASEWMTCNLEP